MERDPQLDFTVHDRGGLKLHPRVSDAEINASEMLGVALAEEKYLGRRPSRRTAPFTDKWMLRLHREMFGGVWRWAGKPRRSNKNIGVAWEQIEGALLNLATDIRIWEGDPIEDAAELHFRAICIHPFNDGNGRWARLLANIWLSQRKYPVVRWPEPHVRALTSPIRQEYVAAIRAGERGDLRAFMGMHRRFLSCCPPIA